MIDGVLAYSSINATEKQIGLVDLNNIVEDIRNDLEVIIQQKGAEIKSEPHAGDGRLGMSCGTENR